MEAGWAPGSVWTGAENLAPPPGFDPRTFQSIAHSLYRLSYPLKIYVRNNIYIYTYIYIYNTNVDFILWLLYVIFRTTYVLDSFYIQWLYCQQRVLELPEHTTQCNHFGLEKNRHRIQHVDYFSIAKAGQSSRDIWRDIWNVPRCFKLFMYSRSKSTKSPSSGASNVSDPWLMSQVERVKWSCVRVRINVFLQPERLRCRYSSAYATAETCDYGTRAVNL